MESRGAPARPASWVPGGAGARPERGRWPKVCQRFQGRSTTTPPLLGDLITFSFSASCHVRSYFVSRLPPMRWWLGCPGRVYCMVVLQVFFQQVVLEEFRRFRGCD